MRTVDLKAIMEGLKEMAASNEDRAYRILGARPGPGPDILIRPANHPLNGEWDLIGLTECGTKFIAKFWRFQPLTNQKVAEMRKQATDWSLVYVTEMPIESLGDEE